MNINANTKIASILKSHPGAMEAIISISPKFNKLRNPLLRKIMASRTSIYAASKVAGCSVNDFFEKLQPIGFSVDKTVAAEKEETPDSTPSFMKNMNESNVEILDVRQVIEGSEDPFNIIMKKIKQLPNNAVLKLVNTFEPVPLINILSKQGFEYFVKHESENVINTFFYKKTAVKDVAEQKQSSGEEWNEILKQFENYLVTIDVRHLPMPQPMITILEALEKLPVGKVLFVHHKRIPVFLLPELKDRKMDYRVKEISNDEVQLVIFHQKN